MSALYLQCVPNELRLVRVLKAANAAEKQKRFGSKRLEPSSKRVRVETIIELKLDDGFRTSEITICSCRSNVAALDDEVIRMTVNRHL